MRFNDKVATMTGAASRIGRATRANQKLAPSARRGVG